MYSNCYCRCSFEAEIIKIGQSSYKMYSNNIVNFQESTTILNASIKKSGNLLNAPRIYITICSYLASFCHNLFIYISFFLSFFDSLSLSLYIYIYIYIYTSATGRIDINLIFKWSPAYLWCNGHHRRKWRC